MYAPRIRREIGSAGPSHDPSIGPRKGGGSTDVADVSWVAPTVGCPHGDLGAGEAGALVAGDRGRGHVDRGEGDDRRGQDAGADDGGSVSGCGGLLAAAMVEYREKAGPDFEYVSLVGDRDPPLDYRRPVGG